MATALADGQRAGRRRHPPSASRRCRRITVPRPLLARSLWLVPVWLSLLCARARRHVFSQIAVFFTKMAVVTFGGAYAVLAYVAQQAVETYGWLQPGEMLDGLGMAETTPGPLIMVLQFVGFMARLSATPAPAAAARRRRSARLLTTWVTFVPCFLWIFLGAPFVETLRGNRRSRRRALGDHRGSGRA